MLSDILIKNFAIIDSLHVTFGAGLNILTGETGAGKSIIIDAVNLVLGGRASGDLIRSEAEEATVEAIFDISGLPLLTGFLQERGIDAAGELLIKRVVARSGKNRIFINGNLSTLAILAELSRRLINIYGQHESQTLLKVENHLEMLDSCGDLKGLRGCYSAVYKEFRKVEEELRRLEEGEREASRRVDLLTYQVDEIARAALLANEEEELEHERTLLLYAEKLLLKSQSGYELLYGGDAALLGTLRAVQGDIEVAASIDAALATVQETLSSAYLLLEDAALALRDYASRIESDPLRILAVDERLELLRRLKKKYGPTIADVIEYQAAGELELQTLRNREQSMAALEEKKATLRLELQAKGAELSAGRIKAGHRLQQALESELQQLAMKHARIVVDIAPLPEPKETGLERVELLFSPNPGELPKPLAKIASGGELSRIMLALKQLHPESDVPTLVFDEVDTGIGGATSALVGQKLKAVASRQQVLCITHLAQVAVFADQHFQVSKAVESGRTTTAVTLLGEAERVGEIARMLGGLTVTEKTLEHAREMIEGANCRDEG